MRSTHFSSLAAFAAIVATLVGAASVRLEAQDPVRELGEVACDDALLAENPLEVSISKPLGGQPGDQQVEVIENIFGALDENITPANGGVKSDIAGSGLTDNGFIKTWFVATNILNPGAAAPGEDAMRQDYLDDGDEINELDYEPVDGDVIVPLAGVMAGNGFNPNAFDGELMVQVVETGPNGILDFNVINGDTNNVMAYMWAYIEVEDDFDVDLCVGSDDSVQILIDLEEVHINNVARGWGGDCQDIVTTTPAGDPIFLEGGVHLVMMKIFEGGGGHRAGLRIEESFTGQAVPGLRVLGDIDGGELPAVGTRITWDVTRQQLADGVGYSVEIDKGIVRFDGTAAGATTTGPSRADICLDPINSATGQIKEAFWAGLGPFTHSIGCGGGPEQMLFNHIAPEDIRCMGPSLGDEIEYDPDEAATNSYIGPAGPDGGPIWRSVSDGNEDGFIDLDLALGPCDDCMAWVATYVENVSGDDLEVVICFGSDDNGQIWVDDVLAHNIPVCRGSGGCQDQVSFTLTPGIHSIKVATWDRGGGWNCNLALLDGFTNAPFLPEDGLLTWLGGTMPAEYEVPSCPECGLDPVRDLTCALVPFGLGGNSFAVELNWENAAETDGSLTSILVNGSEVMEVAADETSATIPATDLPDDQAFTVSVVNCSGIPAQCSPFKTDAAGYIIGGSWLALGPFSTPVACDGNVDALLANAIGPEEHMSCQFPASGDPVDGYQPGDPFLPDPDTASTLGIHPDAPADEDGNPIWAPFRDSSLDNADLDFDQHVGNLDEHVLYLATWIENTTDDAILLDVCFGSDDDGQAWIDDQIIHNNPACRGRGACQDRFPLILAPGKHVIKIGVWEQGGGWGAFFGLTDAETGLPVVDTGGGILEADAIGAAPISDDIIFHGKSRPGDEEDFPCTGAPQDPVGELICVRSGDDIEVSWFNPENNDPDRPISIEVDGVEVAEVDGGDEEFTVTEDMFGDGSVISICVRPEGAFSASCCGVLVGDEIYINCGDTEFTDADGRIWLEDTLANPSPFLTSQNAQNAGTGAQEADLSFDEYSVDNNIDTALFRNERWNDGPIEYTFTGLDSAQTYDVTLFFMEHCCSDGCLSNEPGADACESVGEDGEAPELDAAIASSTCRVFDVLINDELVQDQFSKNTLAACLAGVPAGPSAYYIGVSLHFEGVEVIDGSIKVLLQDLGGGNPPENASIKALCVLPSDGVPARENCTNGRDDDGDGDVDCDDSDCADDPDACPPPPSGSFVRGDVNSSGIIDLTDGVVILNYLFTGGPPPTCQDAADTDDNGQLVISDSVIIFSWLFTGGNPPQSPSPSATAYTAEDCGPDTGGDLGCETSANTCR